MDILTRSARKTSEKPGSFTLKPVEPGLYRIQVSAQNPQWSDMRYNVIPLTASETESTGMAMH